MNIRTERDYAKAMAASAVHSRRRALERDGRINAPTAKVGGGQISRGGMAIIAILTDDWTTSTEVAHALSCRTARACDVLARYSGSGVAERGERVCPGGSVRYRRGPNWAAKMDEWEAADL